MFSFSVALGGRVVEPSDIAQILWDTTLRGHWQSKRENNDEHYHFIEESSHGASRAICGKSHCGTLGLSFFFAVAHAVPGRESSPGRT
jgi:hypothetical protein